MDELNKFKGSVDKFNDNDGKKEQFYNVYNPLKLFFSLSLMCVKRSISLDNTKTSMGSFTFAEKSRTELNFRFKSHFHEICEIVFDNFSQ